MGLLSGGGVVQICQLYPSVNFTNLSTVGRFGTQWKGYKTKFQLGKNHDTAISKDTLVQLGSKLSSIPDGAP